MYTIKQAAARTGLSVPIIRVWERRYGVVQPGRTPAGYRLYDDEAIARLAADDRDAETSASRRLFDGVHGLANISGTQALTSHCHGS